MTEKYTIRVTDTDYKTVFAVSVETSKPDIWMEDRRAVMDIAKTLAEKCEIETINGKNEQMEIKV
jgi:hypothetical protein